MDSATKVRENRLRGMARRQGLQLVKSGRRDPHALDFGRYHLARAADWRNHPVAGAVDGFAAMTLDDAEAWLSHDPGAREKWAGARHP